MTALHETADCDRVRNAARVARLARMSPTPKPVIIEIVPPIVLEPIQVEDKPAEVVPVPVATEKKKQSWSFVVDQNKGAPLFAPVPSLHHIKRVVARMYGISLIEMESSRRTQDIVRPRQIAAYLCATMTRRSLPAIGRALGDRDHTTILHARDKIKELRDTDPDLCNALDKLRSIILETFHDA